MSILFSFILLSIGLVGLIWGADKFISNSSILARKIGISDLIIGLTLIALGTSAPEIFVSISSVLNDTPEKIYIRNQEYSISDIIKYQKSIIRFCDKLSIKYEIIDFNGRDHIEISTLLMHKLNEKIIDNEI